MRPVLKFAFAAQAAGLGLLLLAFSVAPPSTAVPDVALLAELAR